MKNSVLKVITLHVFLTVITRTIISWNLCFYGEDVINGEVVILYSDIIFKKSVIEKLLESKDEISLVVDVKWKKNYVDRYDNPMEAAEVVVSEDNLRVSKVGKIFKQSKAEIAGEFIGMMKLGSQGSETFKSFYHRSREKYKEKPFQRAQSVKVAYLTDLIQELVDHAIPVFYVTIENDWNEIDTIGDFKKAAGFFKKKLSWSSLLCEKLTYF